MATKSQIELVKNLPRRYVKDVPLSELVDWPGNPKDHDLGAIIESIKRNGIYQGVLVQEWPKTPRYIISGHGRKKAYLQLGVTTTDVTYVKCDPKTARRILLADNRTPERGGWNQSALVDFLAETLADDTLDGTGYDGDDLDDLRKLVGGESESLGHSNETKHKCPKCGHEWTTKSATAAA